MSMDLRTDARLETLATRIARAEIEGREVAALDWTDIARAEGYTYRQLILAVNNAWKKATR